MKTIKLFFFVLLLIPFLYSCDEENDDDDEPERTTQLINLENNSGIIGCAEDIAGETITFIISYRDIQVDVTVNDGNEAFINVLVEDGETINVKVHRTSDDTPLADDNVNVRTDSRPTHLNGYPRIISFCRVFELFFENF